MYNCSETHDDTLLIVFLTDMQTFI